MIPIITTAWITFWMKHSWFMWISIINYLFTLNYVSAIIMIFQITIKIATVSKLESTVFRIDQLTILANCDIAYVCIHIHISYSYMDKKLKFTCWWSSHTGITSELNLTPENYGTLPQFVCVWQIKCVHVKKAHHEPQ